MAQLPALPMSVQESSDSLKHFKQEMAALKSWLKSHASFENYRAVGAQQPFYLAYLEGNHKSVLAEYGQLCHQLIQPWVKKVAVPPPVAPHAGSKIKLGIVSAHISSHSVWKALIKGWVEGLDSNSFELHLFHLGAQKDTQTDWARQRAHRFYTQAGSWENCAKLISDQQCDVLIYPEISMDSTTLRLANLRLARLQMAAWGHPMTTGLPTIDYFISAEAFEPEKADAHYSEKLLRLPGLGCSYQALGSKPSKLNFKSLGIDNHHRVLLCPGTSFKYNPVHDNVWVKLAQSIPDSRLVFFEASACYLTQGFKQRLTSAFEQHHLSFEQHVVFIPWQSTSQFFAWMERADAFLDTLGFSGFNTVMQAVECAAPILAFESHQMRGRFASGVMRSMGLDEWVATDIEGYLEKASVLAQSPDHQKQLKNAIRERRSTLFQQQNGVKTLNAWLIQACRPT